MRQATDDEVRARRGEDKVGGAGVGKQLKVNKVQQVRKVTLGEVKDNGGLRGAKSGKVKINVRGG